jgi:3-deoxy-7-phosphoheptulonate synthase
VTHSGVAPEALTASSNGGQRYDQIADEIDRALTFMASCGVDTALWPQLHTVDFYTSHESLILGYEEALTRRDSLSGDWYDCSAHMLWIGERTRDLDGAHVHFLQGVQNPIGCKLGPNVSPDDVVALCDALDPDAKPGRLTLITRMGANDVERLLPPVLEAVRDSGHPVVWACDPMHANTFTSPSGRKTRHFDDVLAEIGGFFRAHAQVGTWPGGVHIELTGDDVTECLGGGDAITDLDSRYETMCDPRLNGRQALDLAFRVADLLR